MGTSSSSSGPKSKVSFDPPWLDSSASEIGTPLEQITNTPAPIDENAQSNQPLFQQVEIAPSRRFSNARRELSKYVKTGNRNNLKKALGNYSKQGMGGAAKLAERMRVSTSLGARVFNFLQEVRQSKDIKIKDWVESLAGKSLSSHEIADEIIKLAIPIGGSLDEESCKNSMASAFSELLTMDPDIDVLNMNNDNIWTVIELFVSHEAFSRLSLDIGQIFESNRYTPREAVLRMNGMREYLKSEISAQIQVLKTDMLNLTKVEINNLLQSAIKNTFEVFEE